MPSFQTARKVRHSAAEMFDLVADVEKYPRFVPLCQALHVRGRRSLSDGREVLVADMTVAYKVFRETFTSQVVLDRARSEIVVSYLDGPFRSLENRWSFRPLGEEVCEVGFYIAYEFKSRTLGSLMGAVFEQAFRRFAEAFENRADEVYGAV
ncbi:type II toxin-antitoxin system RatA family toxin [Pseudoxanthobacter sp.]|uniref:type II toxin-antitoxin system RatA family toxin n=1 Tax=Pseudoxanthobacter sp. TaxID=1925742 RepID=UPI002FE16312